MKQRKANRLRDYNYSQPGSYFVTICTKEQKCLFGRVSGSERQLNALGQIVIHGLKLLKVAPTQHLITP